jgi:alpha-glucosidase
MPQGREQAKDQRTMLDQPHHDGSPLHVSDQAPGLGDTISALVRVPRGDAVEAVHLRSISDGEPRYVAAVVDREDEHDRWWRADLHVRNPVTSYRFLLDRGPLGHAWLNGAGVRDYDVTDGADFRVTTFPPAPAWAGDAVVYQIFPDRFARSDPSGNGTGNGTDELPPWAVAASWGDPVVHRGPETPRQLYGGDLGGIEQHLDHLERLGVNVIYLTPFFPAESNHRYNASSFELVDPLLGGDAALASLTAAAHRRGMRVLGDLTTNHSGDTHPWFRAALTDVAAPEASFYYFRAHPDDYAAWFGHRTLPKLNFGSAELRGRLLNGPGSVAARWLRQPFSLDGWRIDVANMTGRHGPEDYNREVAVALRAAIAAENPDALLLAEHAHDATADLLGDGWHATMNYAGFTKPVWSWLNGGGHGLRFFGMPVPVPTIGGGRAVRAMREFAAAVPWRTTAINLNLLGSHDTPRVRTVVGSEERQIVAAGLLFTYPGMPMLFMGDELGLEAVDGEHARTPMPWSEPARFAGRVPAAYRDLIALRRAQPALRHGGLRWAHAGDDAIAYLREAADDRLLVLAARAPNEGIRLPATIARSVPRNLYGGAHAALRDGALTLPGDGPTFQVWAI